MHILQCGLMLPVRVFVQRMFDRATKKVVKQIDPKGSLIATSSLNDCRKLLPLAVVLKVQKGWFWQQTKYRPTQFTLNHLLDGEEIKPGKINSKYISQYVLGFNRFVLCWAKMCMNGNILILTMSKLTPLCFKQCVWRKSL